MQWYMKEAKYLSPVPRGPLYMALPITGVGWRTSKELRALYKLSWIPGSLRAPMRRPWRKIVDVFLASGTRCRWHSPVSKGRCAV